MAPHDDLLPDFDRSALLVQCGGDEDLAGEVLDLMLEQVRRGTAALRGAEPGRRAAIAHGLKGAARSCGAPRLAEAAAAVERDPTGEAASDCLVDALVTLEAILGGGGSADGTDG